MQPAAGTPIRVLAGVASAAILVTALAAGCGIHKPTGDSDATPAPSPSPSGVSRAARHVAPAPVPEPFRRPLPGMPTTRAGNVYAADAAGNVRPDVGRAPAYLYVPNAFGDPVTTVIDQRTHKIVRVLRTGTLSQHVTPSYDMTKLYVEASAANQSVAVTPRTGRGGRTHPAARPCNRPCTPDGRRGIVRDE